MDAATRSIIELDTSVLPIAASARRFGNMLEPRQINRVLELAGSPDDETAVAAATVAGALALPNRDLVPLITGGETPGNRAER